MPLVSVTSMVDLWRDAEVRPITAEEAGSVAAWRYGDDWSVYDLGSVQPILDNLASYFSVANGDMLIGFFCTGVEARIADMNEEPAVLDVGMGMHPTLVGRGDGVRFGETVVRYLTARYPGTTLRAVIQSWNERSLRVARRLGFDDAGEIATVQGGRAIAYRVVRRRCSESASA